MVFEKKRREMVSVIRGRYGFNDERVLEVLLKVPRHKFAPKNFWGNAYDDAPVDIGFRQTMSQPYTVARMTQLATEFPISNFQFPNKSPYAKATAGKQITNNKIIKGHKKSGKILEVGTGSGYQAAVLSYFFSKVYSMEIIPELSDLARNNLSRLGYKNVYTKCGSGECGWKEHSPFDAIIVTAGVDKVPEVLFDQLNIGGVLVAPVGRGYDKTMTRYTKQSKFKSKYKKEVFGTFHFVPFVEN